VCLSTQALHVLDPDLSFDRMLARLAPTVSAVAVQGEVPADASEAAGKLGIVLLQLPAEETARAAERDASAYLTGQRLEWYQRKHAILHELTELATQGQELTAVTAHLVTVSGMAVVVVDEREVLARSIPSSFSRQNARLLDQFLQDKTQVSEITLPRGPRLQLNASQRDAVASVSGPVTINGRPAATIHLFGPASWTNDEAEFFRDAGAAAAAIVLSREQAVEEMVHQIHGDLVTDLIQGGAVAPSIRQALYARARRLGYDLDHPYAAIALTAIPREAPSRRQRDVHDEDIPKPLQHRVPRVLSAHGISAPVYIEGGILSIFYPVDKDVAAPALRRVGERLCRDLSPALRHHELYAGVSRPKAGLDGFPSALEEARNTLRLGRALAPGHKVIGYADLGVYRLLLAAGPTDEAKQLYDEMVAPLLAYDQRTSSELVPTLIAFLESGNAVEVARRLNLHRNTLRYRLQRIRHITGLDLDDAETRLALYLAVKIGEVLHLTTRLPAPDS